MSALAVLYSSNMGKKMGAKKFQIFDKQQQIPDTETWVLQISMLPLNSTKIWQFSVQILYLWIKISIFQLIENVLIG